MIQLVQSFSTFFSLLPLLSGEVSDTRARSSSSVQIGQSDVFRHKNTLKYIEKHNTLSWNLYLNLSFKSLFRQHLLVVAVVSGAFFPSVCVWKNIIFLLYIEVLLHYMCVYICLAVLCMYPEAETGARSSHPSGKHRASPELTVLLLLWILEGLAAGI